MSNEDENELESSEDSQPQLAFSSLSLNESLHLSNSEERESSLAENPIVIDESLESSASNRNIQSLGGQNKRKRSVESNEYEDVDESSEEDTCSCSICLEFCEISGDHRLASLKCGHLFGFKCIKRWLTSKDTSESTCPECKARAKIHDIRCLFVKKLRIVDRSEEHRLRKALTIEKSKNKMLANEFRNLSENLASGEKLLEGLQSENKQIGVIEAEGEPIENTETDLNLISYNFSKPACLNSFQNKSMLYVPDFKQLLVSQRACQRDYRGFGIRRIDVNTFQSKSFFSTGDKGASEISINFDSSQLAVVSYEPFAKIFDMRNGVPIKTIRSRDQILLSTCAFDLSVVNNIYFGSKSGGVFIVDNRLSKAPFKNFIDNYDTSPVLKICNVLKSKTFPNGGLIVCKVQTIVFYEHSKNNLTTTTMTQIHIDGPYISINYDKNTELLLIFARSNNKFSSSHYFFGKMIKIRERPFFSEIITLPEPTIVAAWSPCAQIPVNQNHLLAAYLECENEIKIYNIKKKTHIQSLPTTRKVLDLCAFHINNSVYLTVFAENMVGIYTITENCD